MALSEDQSRNRTPRHLYKFRDWGSEHHPKILKNHTLYFAPPKKLNDPFDCNIPLRRSLASDEDFEAYVKEEVDCFETGTSDEEKDKIVKMLLENSPCRSKDPEERYQSDLDYLQEVRKAYGVACFSTVMQNVVLWSHYANAHSGFCVKLDAKELDGQFMKYFKNTGEVIRPFWIEYATDYPVLKTEGGNDSRQRERMLITKSVDWKYEAEYRYIYHRPFVNISELDEPWNGLEFPFGDGVISAVYLGCEMKEPVKAEITQTVRQNDPGAQVLQAIRSRNSFDLEFFRI